jgi:ParB family chromosome partitioning protein
MVKKQSLGRGFDVLMPKDIDQSILEEDKHRVQKVLISDITPNPEQPRKDFDADALKELASSIKRHGILQPIIVVRDDATNGYRIVAGERRFRAAKLANLNQIPAIVRSLEELEQIELALIENVQRVDLSPLEQALSVYRLQQQFNLALETIAEKLGKAPSTVSNLTRLLQLPEAAREALRTRKITEGHARTILSLKGLPGKQEELLSCILNNGWSVRQAEQFVLATKKGTTVSKARSNTSTENEATKLLSKQLGTNVKIKHTANGGQLIITFSSDDQLQDLVEKISSEAE